MRAGRGKARDVRCEGDSCVAVQFSLHSPHFQFLLDRPIWHDPISSWGVIRQGPERRIPGRLKKLSTSNRAVTRRGVGRRVCVCRQRRVPGCGGRSAIYVRRAPDEPVCRIQAAPCRVATSRDPYQALPVPSASFRDGDPYWAPSSSPIIEDVSKLANPCFAESDVGRKSGASEAASFPSPCGEPSPQFALDPICNKLAFPMHQRLGSTRKISSNNASASKGSPCRTSAHY